METKPGSYSFLILLSVYLGLHALQIRAIGPEWVRFYGKDLIMVPLLLLGITRLQPIVNRRIKIGRKEILLLVIYLALAFEVVMPLIKAELTTDIWDIIMYATGAQLYYILIRNTSKQNRLKKTPL